jgi:hypothetical protein
MCAPQGGYVAKQCPARAQWNTIRPCEPLPASPFMQRMFKRWRDFESGIVAQLLELRMSVRSRLIMRLGSLREIILRGTLRGRMMLASVS